MKKIVLKVCINCDRDTIAGVGRGEEHADGGGDVDVLRVGKELKKAGKAVEVVSVEPKREEKKEEKEASGTSKLLPPCCSTCRSHGLSHVVFVEELLPFGCNIL
uniref:Uncharacterized protein n=1 Tax=Ananas comosus var. bracteatus TaxID=296719 RepID=A0A6V7QWF4_ANACO